jgi:hypothetical protein
MQVLGSEESVVDDITAPGGLRPLPDAADLRRFVDTASSMDGLRIAELLREKMVSGCTQLSGDSMHDRCSASGWVSDMMGKDGEQQAAWMGCA